MKDSGLFSYQNFVHAVAGSTGSVIAMTAFYPLDTVRARLQLEERRQAKGTLRTVQDLVQEEGCASLYRGVVPVLESLCVSNFVYFYTFHGLRRTFYLSSPSPLRDLGFGCLAGVINVLTTTPLWVVNTRLKFQGATFKVGESLQRPKTDYQNLLDGLYKIYREEGTGALWAGTLPSLILVLNPAIQFMTYEALKRRSAGKNVGPLGYFLMGAVSKAIATVITYPLQIIQAKLRYGHKYVGLSKDVSVLDLLRFIFRNQGVRGLYKGMEAKLLQTVLTAALMFLCYEKIAAFVFRILATSRKAH
ncbi:unnamed protein product [Darwinula stevensoni]|uniref:Peroxisomal membrane protein PMP34 n=1 Tax=Darwinula stevensoni TaxID=69355 RepID=A0A7R8ZZU8_9CRUS|nr:unnamed protein product [Darwinula stevensoni]CAG0879533.1 unnamed protein product [Darwinula stevensoni]